MVKTVLIFMFGPILIQYVGHYLPCGDTGGRDEYSEEGYEQASITLAKGNCRASNGTVRPEDPCTRVY